MDIIVDQRGVVEGWMGEREGRGQAGRIEE